MRMLNKVITVKKEMIVAGLMVFEINSVAGKRDLKSWRKMSNRVVLEVDCRSWTQTSRTLGALVHIGMNQLFTAFQIANRSDLPGFSIIGSFLIVMICLVMMYDSLVKIITGVFLSSQYQFSTFLEQTTSNVVVKHPS